MSDAHGPGTSAIEPIVSPLPQDEPGPEPSRSSRPRLIIVGTLLAVGLAGTAAVGTAGWRITSQRNATLETPVQVAGLIRDDSEAAQVTGGYLRDVVAANIQLDQSMAVVYADPADPGRKVLLFGGTTLLWQPERDLDTLVGLVGDDAGAVADLREVPAGEQGGAMKCATAHAADGDMTICGWADHGSIVLGLFPGRDIDDAAALLRDIRTVILIRD
jgi:hypothetical protein